MKSDFLISSIPTGKWTEKDGVIYFSVTSDGTTGEQWMDRLTSKGSRINDDAQSVLRSENFKPTSGVTSEIAVLKAELFGDSNRTIKNILKEAESRKLTKPNAEVACLIREKFSNRDLEIMGLSWIIAMHEAIEDSDGGPLLLAVSRYDYVSWLDTYCDDYGSKWIRNGGFVFVVSQVSNS